MDDDRGPGGVAADGGGDGASQVLSIVSHEQVITNPSYLSLSFHQLTKNSERKVFLLPLNFFCSPSSKNLKKENGNKS